MDRVPEHKKTFWKFEDVQKQQGNRYVKSYYHILDNVLPMHSHDFYEINIVTGGAGNHYIQASEVLACKGDIFVIPPNVKHGYTCSDKMTVYHILLSNSFFAEYLTLLEKLPGYRFLFHIEPMLRASVEKPFYLKAECISVESVKRFIGMLESGENEAASVCHVLSLIAEMSDKMHRFHDLNDRDLPDRKVLSLIESIEYIENHYAQKLDYRSVANRCAVSYSTYWRLFKKLTGTTPMEYQMRCRIKASEFLLRSTDESIISVALSSGFYDSSHFIREFVKRKHMTPAEFRRSSFSDLRE